MTLDRRHFCLASLASLTIPLPAVAAEPCVDTAFASLCAAKPAERVVTLDQQSTEYVLALGLQPIGVTGFANYRRFTADEEPRLADDVVDLGLSSAPNIELILALQPDLILASVSSAQKSLALLQAIAPVAAFVSYPGGRPDQFGNMVETLRAVSVLTGRQSAAASFLAALDDDIASAKSAFAEAGLGGRQVVLGNINSGVTGAEIMLFNANALPAQILQRCGFRYAQDNESFADKGFIVTTAESLIEFQDADFLYMPFNAKGVENLISTPVWRSLRFVTEGRVYPVAYRLVHNGALSTRLFLRDVREALLL